jgi:hypothetical protein
MEKKRVWKGLGLALVLFVLPGAGLLAQSVGDDITQLVLDVQKLTQLKQILSDMQQAYTMVNKGYEDIRNLSQGTFSLHKAFLDGLLLVSPLVSSDPKVQDIINKEALLVMESQSANGYFQGNGSFTSSELGGFSGRYTNWLHAGVRDITELTMILTPGELRMSDAERLAALDRIDRDVTGNLSELRGFDSDAAILGMQRTRAAQDVGTVGALYGVGQ